FAGEVAEVYVEAVMRGDHIASVPEGRQPANRHDSSERPSGTIPQCC
ncbi:MAG: hypothetical protein GY801_52875, partial [bacterium]|nr:hypothetical protein [bacterium]